MALRASRPPEVITGVLMTNRKADYKSFSRFDSPFTDLCEIRPFREPPAYHPVMYLIRPFLPGGAAVAVVHREPPPAQDGFYQKVVLQEFRPIVCGNRLKPPVKIRHRPLQPVKNRPHRGRFLVWQLENHLLSASPFRKGQQYGAALLRPYDQIHFPVSIFRPFPDSGGPVHDGRQVRMDDSGFLFRPWLPLWLLQKVGVGELYEEPAVDVVIQRLDDTRIIRRAVCSFSARMATCFYRPFQYAFFPQPCKEPFYNHAHVSFTVPRRRYGR